MFDMPKQGAFYDQGNRVYEVVALGAKNADIRVFDKKGSYIGMGYVQAWDINTDKRVTPKKVNFERRSRNAQKA